MNIAIVSLLPGRFRAREALERRRNEKLKRRRLLRRLEHKADVWYLQDHPRVYVLERRIRRLRRSV